MPTFNQDFQYLHTQKCGTMDESNNAWNHHRLKWGTRKFCGFDSC
jgi:hypothetical protein